MRTKIAVAATAVTLAAVAGVVMMRHLGAPAAVPANSSVQANVLEAGPAVTDGDAMRAIRAAGVPIADLSVRSAGGIYIVRGSGDQAAAERAVTVIKNLGVVRVANLVTPRRTWDDDKIRRDAERELASRSALAGTRLSVSCEDGVITVSGTVSHELQKDLAKSTLSAIRGAREVRVQLVKL